MSSAIHGGDVDAVARSHGIDPATLTDFSSNIAPDGPPDGVAEILHAIARDPRALAPYPATEYRELREQIARMLDVEAACVVLGHGGPALLDLALRVCAATSWVVPVPAFSEYRRALDAAKLPMHAFALPPSMELEADAVAADLEEVAGAGVLINTPHNPSGCALDRDRALTLLRRCEAMERPLIVDEAFVDYIPEASIVAQAVRAHNVVVLRSVTKFYALAGVRIAYAIAHPDLARAMWAAGPSWPVGTLDAALALAALRDADYAQRTRDRNARARDELAAGLARAGMSVAPSAANFLLVDVPVSFERFDPFLRALVRQGVIVRDCRSYDGMQKRCAIRVAVLDRASNRRLTAALLVTLAADG